MTVEEYRNRKKEKEPSKFHSVKVGEFDSKAEAERYNTLYWLECDGKIEGLIIHPKVELQAAFRDRTGKLHKAIAYSADFAYYESGLLIWEDIKGYMGIEVFRIKEKLFRFKYPNIDLRIIQKSGKNWIHRDGRKASR